MVIALCLPIGRTRISSAYLAEAEVGGNTIYAIGLAVLAHKLQITHELGQPTTFLPSQLAAILFVLTIIVFVLRGGTHIVRGLLEKGRILPAKRSDAINVDVEEYNRGRIIGNVERLILLTFVSIQAYPALAFLMAAKGLFRAKDLEKREFSEYFLVGTLVSSIVAIAAGLLVKLVLKMLW